MRFRTLAISGFLMFALTACSNEESEHNAGSSSAEPRHVWEAQVNTLDKARRLETDMNAAFEKRVGEIDRQAR